MAITKETNDLMRMLEKGSANIDERKLPIALSQHMTAIEESNKAYEDAQKQEELAKSKVNKVLMDADKLICEAKNAGQHRAEERGWWIFKHTSKRDEIDATKRNLQELIDCGIHSAEAQKELVKVQQALSDSQVSLLKVQKMQMAYQKQTMEAMQFLYLLGAYNMGATQSILINLEATLRGASKDKLGEMAKHQLLMAMDQIKNQENILIRVRENKETIKALDANMDALEDKFEQLYREEHLQNELIAKNAEKISSHAKILDKMTADDGKQDKLIAKNAENISTHEKKLEEMAVDDEAQDELIAKNAENISTHAKKLEEMTADDEAQDELIAKNAENISTHAKKLEEMAADDEAQDELISVNKESIEALKLLTIQQKEEIDQLTNRVNALEDIVNEKGWRTIVTIMATVSLILAVLSIIIVL